MLKNAFLAASYAGILWALFSATSLHASLPPSVQIAAVPYATSVGHRDKGKIAEKGGAIVITAVKGTDLFTDTGGKTHADNTPRLLFQPNGDFIFSAKVSAEFGGAYDGGALIVYADGHQWAKLLFERFESGKNGIATTITSGKGDDAYHGTRTNDHQYLKIARRGKSYVFYSSANGKEWDFLRHFSLHTDLPISVGLSAQSPLSDSLSVEFSEINFRSGTLEDFWQGE